MPKKMLLLILAVFLYLSSIACERKTEAKLEGGNPPVFSIWAGTGKLWFISFGESRQDKSLKPSQRWQELWRVEPETRESGQYTWEIEKVTYGVVPKGYTQKFPAKEMPPPLVAGKHYSYLFKTENGMPASGSFEIRDGKAVIVTRLGDCYYIEGEKEIEVPCDDNNDGVNR